MTPPELPIVVIGAGPIGLAVAAHLHVRGLSPLVLEAGREVGEHIREWGHVQLFTPWHLNVDPTARDLLEGEGWQMPPAEDYPTGDQLLSDYLRPLADTQLLRDAVLLGHRVRGVSRALVDKTSRDARESQPFVVLVDTPDAQQRISAGAVVDASGTWQTPNWLGTDGMPAIGEVEQQERIVYGIPDVLGARRADFAGKRVAVVGSGHSAQTLIRDLAILRAEEQAGSSHWMLRRSLPGGSGGETSGSRLPARSALENEVARVVIEGGLELHTGFRITAVRPAERGLTLEAADGHRVGPFDIVVAATGFRPDLALLSELQIDVDPAVESPRKLAPLIDPALHSCLTVPAHGAEELAHPEPGFYIVGMKSYGRAPTFLLLTGYGQASAVATAIAGEPDTEADLIDTSSTAPVCGDHLGTVKTCDPLPQVPTGCGETSQAGPACGPGPSCCS